MTRFVLGGLAAAISLLSCVGITTASADASPLPMRFVLQQEGPAEVCGNKCRTWVSARGVITADTSFVFETFAKGRNLRGVSFVLDSDGGSVLGAIALGQAVRRFGMTTTVGRTVEIPSSNAGEKRMRLVSDALCESMCTFVLLAGVERYVPPEARVLVHQIWLGDRRDDPTAATYSAEDLVVVQRDIGRLAQYTMEMGGTIELLALTLRIPPWEPMHTLTRDELRNTRLVTAEDKEEMRAPVVASASVLASGTRGAVGDQGWVMTKKAGQPVVTRRHPLTIEGENIGAFNLSFACGSSDQYVVTYTEELHSLENGEVPKSLRNVELKVADKPVPLKVMSSSDGKSVGRDFSASGDMPVALLKAFAEPRNLSMTIEASSGDDKTAVILLGNSGLTRRLAQLAATCAK